MSTLEFLGMRIKIIIQLCILAICGSLPSFALGSWEAELGAQWRGFLEKGDQGQSRSHLSLSSELGFETEVLGGDAELLVFGRLDQRDPNRSHADVREAYWQFVGDEWSLRAGVSKVFWGVTESSHLVDVINQTDALESVDGEDKLGQPMVKLSSEKDWGTIDLFWLPYFREREFASVDGRLRPPTLVDNSDPQYESGAEEAHSDVAIRYSHYIDELEFAVSHFSGTGRAPKLLFNGSFSEPRFIPYYEQIDQTGLELQYIYDAWLLKFEGITNQGIDRRYSAAVAGLEYTQVGIFDTFADLGWLVEYLFDDRQDDPTVFFEKDVFLGWRYAFNDADSSEILAGVIYDPETDEQVYSLELSQRLADDLKVFVEAWMFEGADDMPPNSLIPAIDNKTAFLQSEDFIQLELVKYF